MYGSYGNEQYNRHQTGEIFASAANTLTAAWTRISWPSHGAIGTNVGASVAVDPERGEKARLYELGRRQREFSRLSDCDASELRYSTAPRTTEHRRVFVAPRLRVRSRRPLRSRPGMRRRRWEQG